VGTGRKEFADRYFGPLLLVAFGATVLAGLWINFRDIGWASDNRRGYCSRTERRRSYFLGLAIGALAGAAAVIGGIVMLLLGIS
jgi:hypothetical protein